MMATLSKVSEVFPESCRDRILLVGGTTRDILLQKEPQDLDLVSSLSHEELTKLGFHLVEPTNSRTIYFQYHPTFGKIEITAIHNLDKLELDLQQRDFTVNAIAMTCDGEIIDPLNGRASLETKELIPCSNRTFILDPIRIFRAFSFAAAGWNLGKEAVGLIQGQKWSREFSIIPVERFSNEMIKAFAYPKPELFFQLMIQFNVGTEFLPELFKMPAIPAGPLEHHPEGDLFTHCIQVLQRVSIQTDDRLTRFCAFFHDIGKLATNPSLYPKHHGHDAAGFTMADVFCRRLHLPASWCRALAWISRLHGKANLWESLRGVTKMKIAEQSIKAGIVEILPMVAAADKAGGLAMARWNETIQVAGMSSQDLAIDQERLQLIVLLMRSDYIRGKRVKWLNDMLHTYF